MPIESIKPKWLNNILMNNKFLVGSHKYVWELNIFMIGNRIIMQKNYSSRSQRTKYIPHS